MTSYTAMPIPDTYGPVPHYIVQTASAHMPSSCRGNYGRIAVIETRGVQPSRIDERDRNVVRIVSRWERLNIGKTPKCAFAIALAEAFELAARLNRGEAS